MDEGEMRYLRRRVEQEGGRADAAADPQVALIHRQMAAAYAARIADLLDGIRSVIPSYRVERDGGGAE